jgi:phosphoglycolate phosphatase
MELIIFDLDGTLVDSKQDIATSVNEVLSLMGSPNLPKETIYGYIGDGVRCLIERSLGDASSEDVDRAHEMFLPVYRRHLLDTTLPYRGVREALRALDTGRTLAILSNKPTRESIAVLQGLNLHHHFDFVYGGESFPKRKPDPMGINALMKETGAARERTIMVGDSRVDYEAARNASVSACLVSYGIGAADVLMLDPDYLVDDLRELVPLL